jgi:hypothetical protein
MRLAVVPRTNDRLVRHGLLAVQPESVPQGMEAGF